MSGTQHTYERIADQLASWIDEQSTQLADGFRENGHAPFAATASQSQKLAYYDQQFFNPDGSPNDLGRAGEKERLGQNYDATLAEVTHNRMTRVGGNPGEDMSQ